MGVALFHRQGYRQPQRVLCGSKEKFKIFSKFNQGVLSHLFFSMHNRGADLLRVQRKQAQLGWVVRGVKLLWFWRKAQGQGA